MLTEDQITYRARRIKLVLTDCDGTLTDGSVYYSERGEELLRFNRRDGMGMERLRNLGIETALITRERSQIVRRRMEKLGIKSIYDGVRNKARALPEILAELRMQSSEVAFIGDDVNDLGIIDIIASRGLVGAPSDAITSVKQTAHYCCAAAGGYGAFRDFAEWILEHRTEEK